MPTSDKDNQYEILSSQRDAFFTYPSGILDIRKRRLPHWYMTEAVYNVTFRLADSIPQFRLDQLRRDRAAWKFTYGDRKLSGDLLREYYRLFHRRVEVWLNAGYGSCLLRYPHLRRYVSDALAYFDGQRYILGAWCIMPNHVHILLRLLNGFSLSEVLHSWKSFSALKINQVLNREEQVWQRESYDHIVRNMKSLQRIEKYILENPIKAKLKIGEYDICQEEQIWSKKWQKN